MHDLMHFLADVYFWQVPFGILLFALFGGTFGFAFAKRRHVWRLSAIVTALTIFLIPWSFLVERGDALAPLAYFPIAFTILFGYWLVVGLARLLFRHA